MTTKQSALLWGVLLGIILMYLYRSYRAKRA